MIGNYIKKTLCLFAAAATVTGSALALTPAETYEAAARNMAAHPQGEYTVQMNVQAPFMSVGRLKNKIDIQEMPFKVKSTASVGFLGNETLSGTSSLYAEQDGAVVHVYYGYGDEDSRTWQSYDRPLRDAMPLAATLRADGNVLAGVKAVTAISAHTYRVVYDMSRLYATGDEAKWAEAGLSGEERKALKEALLALQQSGDILADVTIDPATARISHIYFPLTPQLRSIAALIAANANVPEAQKALIGRILAYSSVNVTVDCAPLPENIDFTVPAAAQKTR